MYIESHVMLCTGHLEIPEKFHGSEYCRLKESALYKYLFKI